MLTYYVSVRGFIIQEISHVAFSLFVLIIRVRKIDHIVEYDFINFLDI